jgi:ribosomal protein S18 acetylase RimI-like enzyme
MRREFLGKQQVRNECQMPLGAVMLLSDDQLFETVATANGTLRTRSENEDDVVFLFALFESVKWPEMASMPIDDRMKRQLLQMQFRAMTQGYRDTYPQARFHIVELDDRSIGRLIVDIEPGRADVVYIALLPEWRHRGLGRSLMSAVLAELRRHDAVCRASVATDNQASLRLWKSLGFRDCERTATDVILEWRAA